MSNVGFKILRLAAGTAGAGLAGMAYALGAYAVDKVLRDEWKTPTAKTELIETTDTDESNED